jgi:hypothetical protein
VVEKDATSLGKFHAAGGPHQKLDADRMFQIPYVPAERRLGGVQAPLGGDSQAAFLRHGNEIAEVTKFLGSYLSGMGLGLQSLFLKPPHGLNLVTRWG